MRLEFHDQISIQTQRGPLTLEQPNKGAAKGNRRGTSDGLMALLEINSPHEHDQVDE